MKASLLTLLTLGVVVLGSSVSTAQAGWFGRCRIAGRGHSGCCVYQARSCVPCSASQSYGVPGTVYGGYCGSCSAPATVAYAQSYSASQSLTKTIDTQDLEDLKSSINTANTKAEQAKQAADAANKRLDEAGIGRTP